MRDRFLASLGALTVVVAALSLASVALAGQATTRANTAVATTYTPPRTADGQPDLQGTWDIGTITPLERSNEHAGKEVLTDEEAAALDEDSETRNDRAPAEGNTGTYNAFWWDRGKILPNRRTSLIVDPPDGKLPLTPEGQKRVTAQARRGFDSWEDRSLWERCIIRTGAPMLSSGYNNNFQILQTPDYVVILVEVIHDARIIPMDGRPHIDQNIRQWFGDSRGHWEGSTLVVDTTNFSDKTNFRGSGANMRLVERFTRIDANTLNYEFTVEDPTTFAKPWTAVIPTRKTQGEIYEYACHEGNYGMFGILAGARAQEKTAAEAAKRGSE